MREYRVELANSFEADSPEDAVMQMAAWLADYSYLVGYRVFDNDTGEDLGFYDAEKVGRNDA